MLRALVPVAMLACGAFAQLLINTPTSAVQCEPVLLQWQGGRPPYCLTVLPGGQPAAPPLETIVSDTSGTAITWNVNIASGTRLNLELRDSTGAIAQSAIFTVQPSSDSSCIVRE